MDCPRCASAMKGLPKNETWLEPDIAFGLVGAGLSALVRLLKRDG